MSKDEALDCIYKVQDNMAIMPLDKDEKKLIMRILVGTAKLVSKIDKV